MFLIIIAILSLYLFREFYWKRRNWPPGPLPLGIIGNVHYVMWKPPGYWAFDYLTKAYGPIYTFWMGPYPVVMITDYELMKDTFVRDGDTYVDKFSFSNIQEALRGGMYGVVDTNGEQWRDHRRFALHQFRDLGLGKGAMEERILIEVDCIIESMLKSSETGDFEVVDLNRFAVACVINQLMFGYRFDDARKEEFVRLNEIIKKQLELSYSLATTIVFFCPFTRNWPGLKWAWDGVMEFKDELFGFFDKQIQTHSEEIDYSSEVSHDYVEAFLKEKKKRESEGDDTSFCQMQLRSMCFDLWSAGLETTSSTLSYALVYLLNSPNVVKKMHDEMDRVVGSDRNITMADKNDLPYTLAVVTESQRLLNLLPGNLPHQTTRDVDINGYKIPKGTVVIAQISTQLYNEKVFPNHLEFKPERFIGSDGKFQKIDEMIPFSIGKRNCLGEGIAKMELFLVLANLMHRLVFSCANPPSMNRNMMEIQPKKFRCTASKRH